MQYKELPLLSGWQTFTHGAGRKKQAMVETVGYEVGLHLDGQYGFEDIGRLLSSQTIHLLLAFKQCCFWYFWMQFACKADRTQARLPVQSVLKICRFLDCCRLISL